FGTDKRIFNSFIAMHDLDQWHRILRRWMARSRHVLPPDIVERYNDACNGSIMDMLQRGKRADNQAADPTGLDALTLAKTVRATLRTLQRRGLMSKRLQREIAALNDRKDLATLNLLPSLQVEG